MLDPFNPQGSSLHRPHNINLAAPAAGRMLAHNDPGNPEYRASFPGFLCRRGALLICAGIFGFWRMGRPSTTFDRWGWWFCLLAAVIAGAGFIAFGWLAAHS